MKKIFILISILFITFITKGESLQQNMNRYFYGFKSVCRAYPVKSWYYKNETLTIVFKQTTYTSFVPKMFFKNMRLQNGKKINVSACDDIRQGLFHNGIKKQ